MSPYAAPQAHLGEPGVAGDLASRGSRLGAAFIDGMVAIIIAVFVTMLAIGAGPEGSIIVMLLSWVLFAAAQAYLLWDNGQTIGKRAVNIKIVRHDGARASLPRILGLRMFVPALIGVIPFIGFFFSIGNILFIFADDRRCLHDHIADTVVINA